MILQPMARVFIQRSAPIIPAGVQQPVDPGFIGPLLPTPIQELGDPVMSFGSPTSDSEASGFPFEASVTMAVKDAVSLATLVLAIPNLKREEVAAIPANALIRLDAGYLNGTGPEVRPIFLGFLSRPTPKKKDGQVTWTFAATSAIPVISRARVAYTATNKTIGAAIEDMCKILLLPKPILPAEAYGLRLLNANDHASHIRLKARAGQAVVDEYLQRQVTLGTEDTPYTPTKGFMEEVQDLIKRVQTASGRAIGQVPNHENPFQLIFVNLTKGGYVLKNTINLDSDIVQEAEPIIDQATPVEDLVVTAEEAVPPDQLLEQSYVAEFSITQAFDPRITIGQITDFQGEVEGMGTFQIAEVEHTISPTEPWTTHYQGPFLGGDFLRAKPGSALPEDELLAS